MSGSHSVARTAALAFAWTALTLAATFANARTQVVNRIEWPAQPDGTAVRQYPAGTRLDDLNFDDMRSYEGAWKNGLAEGEGIVRFPDTPSGGYLGTTLPDRPNYYIGSFAEGRPKGEGTLVHSSPTATQSITGMFTERELVMSIDGQQIAVVTRLTPESPVRVRAMQYVGLGLLQPSRMFFGSLDAQGKITGDWVDVPWFHGDDKLTVVGYGRVVEQYAADGSSVSCTYPPRPADPHPDVLARSLIVGNGNIDMQRVAALDRYYAARAECVSTNREGWTWTFTADFSASPAAIQYHGCRTPEGKQGKLEHGGTYCKEKQGHKQDVFTNIGREFKRFVDRRILGNIDKMGGSFEKAMCRATGTEPGKNCNVNVSIGASWPVGDGPAPGLPAEEAAARNAFLAQSRRAARIPGTLAGTDLGDAAGMAADLNAICSTLCASSAQRSYSASLLSDLERVAAQPASPDLPRTLASIERETASVLSGSLRVITIGSAVAAPVAALTNWVRSVRQASVTVDAMDALNGLPPAGNLAEIKRRNDAMRTLYALHAASLNNAAMDSVQVLGTALTGSIRILRGFPPQRVRALSAAIAIGRSEEQIRAFVQKYQDVKDEQALYDAIIKETLAPLGIAWPPP